GALENCAIFSLGIMPYISASIMMQLLTAVIPQLGRLAREDGGRQKIMQLTRYTTLGLCLFQGYLLALSFQHPESYHTMLPVITITQGVRKITVQYAKRVVGRKMYGGQTQYMPLKVNYAGVMPIIFAWALLLFPATIVQYGFRNSPTAARIASALSTGWPHYVALAAIVC